MHKMLEKFGKNISAKLFLVLFILSAVSYSSKINAEPLKNVLCDIRVLYLFDNPSKIDWPTLYYLNDRYGCRIDLVTLKERSQFKSFTKQIEDKKIYLHTYYLPVNDTDAINSLITDLFKERRSDIVLLDIGKPQKLYRTVSDLFLNLKPASSIFNVQKIYRKQANVKDNDKFVVLNQQELFTKYYDRIKLEVPTLFPEYTMKKNFKERLTYYRLLKNNLSEKVVENNFLSGIKNFRLVDIVDSLFTSGPIKSTILLQSKKFISYFNAAQISQGKNQVDLIVKGYNQLIELNKHKRVVSKIPEFQTYLRNLLELGKRLTLDAVGIKWDGQIMIHDSPHGLKLKFLASLSNNGPEEVEINGFSFYPYWDTTVIPLATEPIKIIPHQSYVREFLVDIDPSHLEGEIPDSLVFTTDVAYGEVPLTFTSKIPVWVAPNLKIQFEPDYYFVKPFAKLEVDHIVSSLYLKIAISKPYDYTGKVQLNLVTPRGLYAGAYRKEINLDEGSILKTLQIPFTISNLFELGVQKLKIELLIDKKLVSSNMGHIRIASCKISPTLKVAFLPDTTGSLEDVLNMTDAAVYPFTNHSLITADFNAYDVIIVGSGAFKFYPNLKKVKSKFEDFLRQGGSLVIFGQPDNWPERVLPVSLIPTDEVVDNKGIKNNIPSAKILSKPYLISEIGLFSTFYDKKEVASAVVAPSEKVFMTSGGSALLSISRLGSGQIIYCGLPLFKMISKLDIDAIHLFANILNY